MLPSLLQSVAELALARVMVMVVVSLHVGSGKSGDRWPGAVSPVYCVAAGAGLAGCVWRCCLAECRLQTAPHRGARVVTAGWPGAAAGTVVMTRSLQRASKELIID